MSAVTMTFSMLIHHPQTAAPVLIPVRQQRSCGKKGALVQSGLRVSNVGIDSDRDKILP
jgi:hypothetical protein